MKSPKLFPNQLVLLVFLIALVHLSSTARSEPLLAGTGKADITDYQAGPVNDVLYVKALALRSGKTSIVLVTVDAVSLGEIGYIPNDYLPKVRARLQQSLGIPPTSLIINASHCHGIVSRDDVEQRTVDAVTQAWKNMVPVKVGVGTGREDRVSENRRLFLKSGREADVRHAYSLPPDDEVAGVGPIDPEIGVVRFDRLDGSTLAVLYNFACHPIQGVANGGNTADIIGYSSKVIEDHTSKGTLALFFQGCAGDINPVLYKDVSLPRDAEPLGNMLGLSTLRAASALESKPEPALKLIHQVMELPRADLAPRIESLQAEQLRLLQTLQGTSLNLKTFLPLIVKYEVSGEFPSYYSHRYMHDKNLGRDDFEKLDLQNRKNIEAYVKNIHTMELLTRNQTNLALLKKHHEQNLAAEKRTIDVEVIGFRIGEFVMITFPGELTVQIGLNIKQASPHEQTFVAGYTNGYIYYSPTAEQLANIGGAQEDSDCILAPEWHPMFEVRVAEILKDL